MTEVNFVLRPRDPIIARTASPFTADPGAQATTLEWPLPQTIAHALRTHIGEAMNADWLEDSKRKEINSIQVHGGFRIDQAGGETTWTPYFPAPRDAMIVVPKGKTDPETRWLQPGSLRDGEGANLPQIGGRSADLVIIDGDEKPKYGLDYWSVADTIAWLIDPASTNLPVRFCSNMEKESRTHVTIERSRGTAKEGHLFSTTGLAFSPAAIGNTPKQAMLCRLRLPNGMQSPRTPAFFSLGGERRQVRLEAAQSLQSDPWDVPEKLVEQLTGKTSFRLQLVTPAIFRTGWYPGWLSQAHRDRYPDAIKGMHCTLVSAVTERPLPVSGWKMRASREKPLRYAVPAGSVYFLKVDRPLTSDQVKALWLAPVSDTTYDREDGFGLALPGVWLADTEDGK